MTKDYYTILGVAPTASSKEIESAYEKLAAKHMPSSPQEAAEVEEAYLILSNPEARSQYDHFYRFVIDSMKNFDGIDPERSREGPRGKNFVPAMSGQDLQGDGEFNSFDLADIIKSAVTQVAELVKMGASDAVVDIVPGQKNNIYIDLFVDAANAQKGGYQSLSYSRLIICPDCRSHSNGFCLKCDGQSKVPTIKRVEINIPKNTAEGTVLRVIGEGHDTLPGLPGGDLFVKVLIKKSLERSS